MNDSQRLPAATLDRIKQHPAWELQDALKAMFLNWLYLKSRLRLYTYVDRTMESLVLVTGLSAVANIWILTAENGETTWKIVLGFVAALAAVRLGIRLSEATQNTAILLSKAEYAYGELFKIRGKIHADRTYGVDDRSRVQWLIASNLYQDVIKYKSGEISGRTLKKLLDKAELEFQRHNLDENNLIRTIRSVLGNEEE